MTATKLHLRWRIRQGISTKSPPGGEKNAGPEEEWPVVQKDPKTELARSILEVNSEDLEGRKLRKLAAEPVTGYPDMTLEMKEKVMAELWRGRWEGFAWAIFAAN